MVPCNATEQVDILKIVFQELHTSIRSHVAMQSKIAFGLSTALAAFAIFLLRGEYQPQNYQKWIAVALITILVTFGIWIIYRNSELMKVNCRMIVRIEQAFGLYAEGAYITKEVVEHLGEIPFPEPSIMPPEVMHWGMSNRWQPFVGHAGMVLLAGAGAALAILAS